MLSIQYVATDAADRLPTVLLIHYHGHAVIHGIKRLYMTTGFNQLHLPDL